MSPRPLQPRGVAFACLAALALAASTAAAQTASPEIPSPFDAPAQPAPQAQPAPPPETLSTTPTAPAQPPPAAAVATPAPAPVESAPGPVVLAMPAPAPYAAVRPARGMRPLTTGIALFAAALVPVGIAAGLSPHWEGCAWNEDTLECGHTGAYLASMILFGFGAAIGLAAVCLIPIGAVALARSRSANGGGRWASFSPFAAPGRDGGAVFGVAGLLPSL
jgi:hypothetical protein